MPVEEGTLSSSTVGGIAGVGGLLGCLFVVAGDAGGDAILESIYRLSFGG